MSRPKVPTHSASRRSRRNDAASPSQAGSAEARGAGHERPLNEVDREVIEVLVGFRDALRDRVPLETKYTVRQVVAVEPPPRLTPADVRQVRESLGLSQPVFADFLGTSTATVRSWEQGQKPPSPMARRFLGLIAADPPYWKSQFRAMVRTREDESGESGCLGVPPGAAGERPGGAVHPLPRDTVGAKGVRNRSGPKSVK